MQEISAYTLTVSGINAEPAADEISAGAVVLTGIIAVTLIYVVTSFLPNIAAAADKLLGRKGGKPNSEESGDGYKVYDIYEGEKNLDDDNEKEQH
ncbi:MAG: hypothetical protein NC120_10440 [Ruminococcus sp.]|nr:hypothetical protein [Ruminococcus sp.]